MTSALTTLECLATTGMIGSPKSEGPEYALFKSIKAWVQITQDRVNKLKEYIAYTEQQRNDAIFAEKILGKDNQGG